jgi:hypothetical protein
MGKKRCKEHTNANVGDGEVSGKNIHRVEGFSWRGRGRFPELLCFFVESAG